MDSGDFFVGPAVVVDDKIDLQQGGMVAVVDQIRKAGMPVLTRSDLPDDEEVRHWGGFTLIVLDWELVSAGEAGVALPRGLHDANASRVATFVERLLTELYCPVFIISNQGVDEIKDELATRMSVPTEQIDAHVLVRSKNSVESGLMNILEQWVREHPAVYAFKSWEHGYHGARQHMFSDFEVSSTDWPRVLWTASVEDMTDPHFELTETISRNILHRFMPLVFDEEVLAGHDLGGASLGALREVIHRNAVVPQASLHSSVVMPGDFFAATAGDETSLLLNVTPACDLVPRTEGSDDVRMTVLEATLVPDDERGSKAKIRSLRKKTYPTAQLLWVLMSGARPYKIDFKKWSEVSWLEYRERRIGRLLDPYIVDIQQRFALHFHRQGLPHLPDSFYEGN